FLFAIRYSLFALSAVRGWGEETAARAVRPLAAPVGAVGRGLRCGVGHDLGARLRRFDRAAGSWGVNGRRLAEDDVIAVGARAHLLRRQGEAIPFPAAPFARGVLVAAARDPGIVRVDFAREEKRDAHREDGKPEGELN